MGCACVVDSMACSAFLCSMRVLYNNQWHSKHLRSYDVCAIILLWKFKEIFGPLIMNDSKLDTSKQCLSWWTCDERWLGRKYKWKVCDNCWFTISDFHFAFSKFLCSLINYETVTDKLVIWHSCQLDGQHVEVGQNVCCVRKIKAWVFLCLMVGIEMWISYTNVESSYNPWWFIPANHTKI